MRTFAAGRAYGEAGALIEAVEQLAEHFDELRTRVVRIDELINQKEQIFSELEKQLLEDYEAILDPNEELKITDYNMINQVLACSFIFLAVKL